MNHSLKIFHLRQLEGRAFLERVLEPFGEDVDRVVDQRRLRQDQLKVDQGLVHKEASILFAWKLRVQIWIASEPFSLTRLLRESLILIWLD